MRGTFPGTDWESDQFLLTSDGQGTWSGTLLNVPVGGYEYKLVVNGTDWEVDSANQLSQNGNSFVAVGYQSPVVEGNQVTFSYHDPNASEVRVAGDFCDWTPQPMTKDTGTNLWTYTATGLSAGDYQYKFIVGENDWHPDPANPEVTGGDNNSAFHITDSMIDPGPQDEIISPEVNGREVTFRYQGDGVNSVWLIGTMNNWNQEEAAKFSFEKREDGVWELTVSLEPGKYEYKFLVNGEWTSDPLNENKVGNDGNAVVVVPGLCAPQMECTVKKGDSLIFPEQLTLYDAEGSSSEVSVNYEVNGITEGATIAGNVLTVSEDFAGEQIMVTAKQADGDATTEFAVNVVEQIYTYTIYFYDFTKDHMTTEASDLWVWEEGQDGIAISFTDLEKINGRNWLKAVWQTPATEIGMKARSFGNWDGWQMDADRTFSNTEKEDCTLYIVNGGGLNGVYTEPPELPESGRTFYVPGTFPGPSWDAASNKMTLYDEENEIYSYTFKEVPAAIYQFKISVNGTWDENYGVDGSFNGGNYSVDVPDTRDVTVYYSDRSHLAVTDVAYQFLDITLTGSTVPEGTKLTDPELRGIYAAKLSLKAGKYSDFCLQVAGDERERAFSEFELKEDREVNFYYSPASDVWYCDAVDWIPIEAVYDSKDEEYKTPFGAVATGEAVTFCIDVTDIEAVTNVNLVVGQDSYPMTKTETISEGMRRWTYTKEDGFPSIGEQKYYFLIGQNGGVKIYCDDDGNYGKGKLAELTELKAYDMVVYQAGYHTPDWMKDAVIYQIFPDRFFDGNAANNHAQESARGSVKYEFPSWEQLPENPDQNDADAAQRGAFVGDDEWSNEIYGGDLDGITQKVEYLKSLGVTVIYLNPVFSSISNHRYDTSDYREIDPILGDLGDFRELVEAAYANGMHIILDGVFNHVSDDSKYFDRYYKFLEAGTNQVGAYPYWAYVYDYMAENGVEQAEAEKQAETYFKENYGITDFTYTTWFDIFDKPMEDGNKKPIYDSIGLRTDKPVYGYDGWWGYDSMPIIKSTNGSEYQTTEWANEIINNMDSVTRYWLKQGSNGWRLDVANEVSDETWVHFREVVKSVGDDNVIIGEIWDDATKYLMGNMYDSVMNYMFRNAVTAFAKGGSSTDTMNALERLRERYPKEAFYAMMNLVDSHDTARIVSYLDGIDDDRTQKDADSAFPSYEKTSEIAKNRQKLVAFLQFTYAGAPTIYYGDERGIAGGDDPDDRRTIDWSQVANPDLLAWYQKLGGIRHDYSALRTGSVEPIEGTSENILGYVRRDEAQAMIVLANHNAAAEAVTLQLADLGIEAENFKDLISDLTVEAVDGSITVSVPACSGVIFTADAANPEEIKPLPEPKPIADLSFSITPDLEDLNPEQEWNVTVDLHNPNINGAYGGVEFIDGIAHFKMKAGEVKTVSGLPLGTQYTMEVTGMDMDGNPVHGETEGTLDEVEKKATITEIEEDSDPGNQGGNSTDPGGQGGGTANPGGTTNPGGSGGTTNPGQGSDPSNPGQGSDPSNPGQGSDPSNPSQGGNSTNPGQSGEPSNPGQNSDPGSNKPGPDDENGQENSSTENEPHPSKPEEPDEELQDPSLPGEPEKSENSKGTSSKTDKNKTPSKTAQATPSKKEEGQNGNAPDDSNENAPKDGDENTQTQDPENEVETGDNEASGSKDPVSETQKEVENQTEENKTGQNQESTVEAPETEENQTSTEEEPDGFNLTPILLVLAAAAFVLFLVLIFRKKKKGEE